MAGRDTPCSPGRDTIIDSRWRRGRCPVDASHVAERAVPVDASHVADDLETVIFTEQQILARVAELAEELHREYRARTPVLVGVLGGAATS